MFRLVILSTFCCFLYVKAANDHKCDDIFREILLKANPKMKPNVDGLKVDFALSLIDIASEDDGVFKLIMWPKLSWSDPRLAWSSNAMQSIRIPIDDIWQPDIVGYNLLDAEEYVIKPLAVVDSTGSVLVIPSKKYTVRCNRNENKDFVCKLKFGSWTYSDRELNLALSSNKLDIEFFENAKFQVIDSNVEREVKKYEGIPDAYITLNYSITFGKKK